MTINVMGVEQGKRLMDLIMQTISREGRYIREIDNKVEFEDLIAQKLVQFKILQRNIERHYPVRADCFVYDEGENFAEANLKGAYKFIEEEKKRLNPSKKARLLKTMSDNPIFNSVVSAILGFLLSILFK